MLFYTVRAILVGTINNDSTRITSSSPPLHQKLHAAAAAATPAGCKKKEYEHALHIVLEEGRILSTRGEKIQCP
jgi:hypothetical protein